MMSEEDSAVLNEIIRDFAFYIAGMFETISYDASITIPSRLSRDGEEREIKVVIELKVKHT